ncbi:protein PYRICULARIA ORYZAE RESISTANCE 21-like [Coffea eugenioides]|uniref:protein PYRICULARIA ORYZAE RESISTANCE 21-like n=1 Tax=Coffea eugenioides TaxID=49369 RepID=UPI000F6075AC|nr:protein PYRICULARIA ORYZAE RESISTANCE 21-like [Coffea eugenioides]XP_027183644.1 protein PYRICULARIA ORYZAE RESISTANCE 21-like [Coffea eugenioides]
MAEKVTTMTLKVDLQCPCCYKKVKKILCKFPQIRDQIYDEKKNLVTITVVCCSPEKIRDKLYCKGGKVIKCIEIVEPGKSQEPKGPKPDEKSKKKKSEPPPSPPPPPPCSHPPIAVAFCCVLCSEGYGGGRCCCRNWRPVPPHACGCGCGGGYSHCDYFSEQITGDCTIM